MPAPYSAATAAATTGMAYSSQRKIELLCDGSYLILTETAANILTLYTATTPNATPTFTAVTNTFTIASTTAVTGDLFVSNNGSTSSDVWVVWASNTATNGLWVQHGVYTPGTGWTWDVATSIALGSVTGGFMIPTIVWNGTNLIIATRGNSTNYNIYITWTATKNGTAGWSALYALETTSGTSHYYPQLLHDSTNQLTLIVYTMAGDTIYARVLSDATTPTANTNWLAKTALSGTVNVGADNIAAVLDTANSRLHLVYIASASSTNPQYNSATYTSTTITAGTSFSAGNGSTAATGVAIGLDGATTPNVWMFWSTAAAGAASDINYRELNAPYGSGNLVGSAANLTNNTAHDNNYPHLPGLAPFTAGYVPLVYAFTVSPWTIEYDNSITSTAGSGSGPTLAGSADSTSTGTASISTTLGGDSAGVSTSTAVVLVSHPLFGSSDATSGANADLTAGIPGTGIGAIVRSTQSQSWPNSTTGAGSGTETDLTYTDAQGGGWALGMNPTYGGVLFSSKYEKNNNALGPNQHSFTTTVSGGHIHWLDQSPGGVFGGSEDGAFTLTELAPTGIDFRAYYQGTWGPDALGFNWAVYACVYPGDPGLVAYRFDMINPSASAIPLAGTDSLEVALIGSMQQATTDWTPTHGFYGQLGGTPTTGWPAGLINVDPDYVGIIPNPAGTGLAIGYLTVKQKRVTALSPAWSGGQIVYLQNTSRLKLKVQGVLTSFPASTTESMYFLMGLRRNLTAADAAAMAADYINPGTPSVRVGTFSSFSYDTRAYVLTAGASGAQVAVTADLTPANVSVRYKPVYEIDGWTGGTPTLTWGGVQLVNERDYRHYLDVANNVLYIQLYFDIVASAPTGQQRVNSELVVTPTWTLSSAGTSTAPGALAHTTALNGSADSVSTATATLTQTTTFVGTAAGAATANADLTVTNVLAGSSAGASTASATLSLAPTLAGSSVGASTAAATLSHTTALAGTSVGASVANSGLGGSLSLAGNSAGVSTAPATLSLAPTLAGSADSTSTATANVVFTRAMAGAAVGQSTANADITVTNALSGSSVGVATGVASLSGATGLSGSAGGASVGTATLTVAHPLAGASVGASTGVAAIGSVTSLAGASVGVSTAAGDINATTALGGSADGVAVANAVVSVLRTFVGTSDGVSTAVAVVTSGAVLSGSADSVSGASATVVVSHLFAGVSVGASGAVSAFILSHSLVGNSDGTSTAVCTLLFVGTIPGSVGVTDSPVGTVALKSFQV